MNVIVVGFSHKPVCRIYTQWCEKHPVLQAEKNLVVLLQLVKTSGKWAAIADDHNRLHKDLRVP